MRVIAGAAGGIPLDIPKERATRPFLEKARGALFNSLADRVIDAYVLDLYAGSGALGIEALSRGGRFATFVEASRKALPALERNMERCRFTDRSRICKGRVEQVLPSLGDTYDLIFADPPFADAKEWDTRSDMAALRDGVVPILAEGGRVVFRLELKGDAPVWPGLDCVWQRRYGRSLVCQYERATDVSRDG